MIYSITPAKKHGIGYIKGIKAAQSIVHHFNEIALTKRYRGDAIIDQLYQNRFRVTHSPGRCRGSQNY